MSDNIVTPSGLSVTFDDQSRTLTLCTPAKNTLVLSDQEQGITIQDQHGNSIILSASGITINSNSSMHFQAEQQISFTANQGITMSCLGGDLTQHAMNITQQAESQYTANAGMSSKLTSGLETKVSGAMVYIN